MKIVFKNETNVSGKDLKNRDVFRQPGNQIDIYMKVDFTAVRLSAGGSIEELATVFEAVDFGTGVVHRFNEDNTFIMLNTELHIL